MTTMMPSLAHATPTSRPLIVDLDGTLTRSDLLIEALFLLAGERPRAFAGACGALLRGKAALKDHMSRHVRIDPATLPYDQNVLDVIERARADGRPVFLVSASPTAFVEAVADHLGLFDGHFASDSSTNLAGVAKALRLTAAFGEDGFDYIGNAAADRPVWHAAAEAIGVRVPARITRQMARQRKPLVLLDAARPTWRTWLRLLRVHQYAKNMLVFVPMLASGAFSIPALLLAVIAFAAYSLVASSIYIINDLVDLSSDRRHPRKCSRPLASGLIEPHRALAASGALLVAGLVTAWLVSGSFLLVLLAYLAMTTAYSFYLKRKFLVDVVALSLLYTVRVVGGGVVSGIVISEWLLGYATMIFTCLALIKRYVELAARLDGRLADADNRDYKMVDMHVVLAMAIAAGFNSITILALYLASPEVHAAYSRPSWLWALCPLMLYWTGRILMMAHRRQVPDDPVVFALRDRVSRLIFGGILAVMLAAH
jgi:4-hydroxybenzoate polyprenyltransferase/phosphoserine phosphatase